MAFIQENGNNTNEADHIKVCRKIFERSKNKRPRIFDFGFYKKHLKCNIDPKTLKVENRSSTEECIKKDEVANKVKVEDTNSLQGVSAPNSSETPSTGRESAENFRENNKVKPKVLLENKKIKMIIEIRKTLIKDIPSTLKNYYFTMNKGNYKKANELLQLIDRVDPYIERLSKSSYDIVLREYNFMMNIINKIPNENKGINRSWE